MFLEIIPGLDNIIFISIAVYKEVATVLAFIISQTALGNPTSKSWLLKLH
tara:strand:+ start:504 stop:653 length:150 start_codon:yes stop_codon:yes gene_type:complete